MNHFRLFFSKNFVRNFCIKLNKQNKEKLKLANDGRTKNKENKTSVFN